MTDKEIVALFWERDEKAIAETKKKYGRYCSAVAGNILNDEQDTEECVNDTMLRLWENIPPERPERLGAFAAKISRRLAIDAYRKTHAERRGGGCVSLVFDELAEVTSDKVSVEKQAELSEIMAAINRFLEGLTKKSRIIFVARYSLCESAGVIAKRLGMTESSVCTSLSRTRSALRAYLKKEGFDL